MIHLGHISAWWLALAFYLGGFTGFILASILAVSGRISREEEAEAARRAIQGDDDPRSWMHG